MLGLFYISFKSKRARRILQGCPVVLVRDGRALEQMLRCERMTQDEIEDAARQQGIRHLEQIHIGILESDGSFSFIRYDDERPDKAKEPKV
ncbi:MAG: DUF421 domain-containing protein [Actinomycetota bacterium]